MDRALVAFLSVMENDHTNNIRTHRLGFWDLGDFIEPVVHTHGTPYRLGARTLSQISNSHTRWGYP